MKIATKSDWKIQPMPKKNEKFKLDNDLSEIEIKQIKMGHIPQQMEDKWFSYFEENKLYLHRSWTGFCIFIVEFSNNELIVTVNRDKKQCKSKIDEDKKYLYGLLHLLGDLRNNNEDDELNNKSEIVLKPTTDSQDLLNKALALFDEAKKMESERKRQYSKKNL